MKAIIYKLMGYGLTYYSVGVFDLEERKQAHIKWYKERNIKGCPSYCSSFEILKQGDEWDIILLEEISDNVVVLYFGLNNVLWGVNNLIKTVVEPVAFLAVDPTARTIFRLLPYAKKLAAVKNDVAVLESGLPKRLTKVISLSTCVIVSAGPHLNAPANAPAVVRTEGTTVVWSTSETFTPGEI